MQEDKCGSFSFGDVDNELDEIIGIGLHLCQQYYWIQEAVSRQQRNLRIYLESKKLVIINVLQQFIITSL